MESETITNPPNPINLTETTPKPDVSKKKTKVKEKLPIRKRIARCNSCSNEWVASNGNERKPSRCPVCMSRNVQWRDEVESDSEIDVEKSETKVEKQEEEIEMANKSKKEEEDIDYDELFFDDGDYDEEEKFTYEDAKNAVPKIPMQAIIFIVGGLALFVGIMFLAGKGKRSIPQPQQETQIETTQTQADYTYLPPIGGGF